jgi:4-hydroxy-2-oxoheptanedioate aldolase
MSRINRAIELLEQGQPVYYTGVHTVSYESGIEAAQSWADILMVDMEHGPFDLMALEQFMQGLVDAGPTRSGHLTPTVIVTLPTDGTNEAVMLANAWMIKQLLARGVHGLLLCHAESPGAVKVFVESARYSFQSVGVGNGLNQGRRGGGGQGSAAAKWGVTALDYLDKADVWPLNPQGELMLGLKIENHRALVNAQASAAVPGLAFAEWGPGDMGMSFGHKDAHDPPYPQEMIDARARVKRACEAAGIAFLNGVRADNVTAMIDEGVRVCSCPSAEVAEIGRTYTKRSLPW